MATKAKRVQKTTVPEPSPQAVATVKPKKSNPVKQTEPKPENVKQQKIKTKKHKIQKK